MSIQKLNTNYDENDNDELGKIKFNQYINENIINNSNSEMEINKSDLIKEIKENIENGLNYIEQINYYFGDRETLKIFEIQNLFNPQRSNYYHYNTEEGNTKNKFYSSSLDFLSSDLPKDKNREKILKPTFSQKKNKIKKKDLSEELTIELDRLNLPKRSSIIKPKNSKINFKNRRYKYNQKEKEKDKLNKKKEYIFNILNDITFSPFIKKNKPKNSKFYKLITPKNKKINLNLNNEQVSLGIENTMKKDEKKNETITIFTNANVNPNEDFFFKFYQTFSNENQLIQCLDNQILKVSKREKIIMERKNENEVLKDSSINNTKSNLLDSIGLIQKNIISSKNINKENLIKPYLNKEKNSENYIKTKNLSKLHNRISRLQKIHNNLNENNTIEDINNYK